MKDEDLIRWFRFTDKELKIIWELLICSPKMGRHHLRMLDEIRAVNEIRKKTPYE